MPYPAQAQQSTAAVPKRTGRWPGHVLALVPDPPPYEQVALATRAGASGFIDVASEPAEFAAAILAVNGGDAWFPASQTETVLRSVADDLATLGLVVEAFGPGVIAVRETPAVLGQVDATALIRDIADEIAEAGSSAALASRIDAVLSRIACHGSVRTGRRMSAPEMNALLRQMEETPRSGQCNHGRPTYVELKLHEIERLFGRT